MVQLCSHVHQFMLTTQRVLGPETIKNKYSPLTKSLSWPWFPLHPIVCRHLPGLYVREIVPGCTAALDGRLRRNDRILSINGIDSSEGTQEQAARLINVSHHFHPFQRTQSTRSWLLSLHSAVFTHVWIFRAEHCSRIYSLGVFPF